MPCRTATNKKGFIGLKILDEGYAKVKSFDFRSSPETETVLAKRNGGNGGFYFESVKNGNFIWVAQLKQRRALRTAWMLGQQMTRLGFDEFEPFRT